MPEETLTMKPLRWDVAGLLQVIEDPECGYTESALTAFGNEDGSQATIGEVRAYLLDCQRRGITSLPERCEFQYDPLAMALGSPYADKDGRCKLDAVALFDDKHYCLGHHQILIEEAEEL